MRLLRTPNLLRALLAAVMVAAGLCGCASAGKGDKLHEAQYAYSAAIRWGDFEGAWNLVDPKYREAHPLTEMQFERYKQIQISKYNDIGSQTLADGIVVRQIQIGVVNRNNMTERGTRYLERWRFDAEAGAWWLDGPLPDLWQGE
ncbi:MAG: hypothetical protein ACREO8_10330 [Luteimonas sp.]